MQRLSYPIPAPLNGPNLSAEIEAAIGVPVALSIEDGLLIVVVPDGTDEPTVAAVVAAHTGELTPEQVIAAEIVATGFPFTPDQYAAVRQQMQVLRDLRQMGRNAFMALSAAERDRAMYDAFTAVTIVLLALLRDDTA